MKILIIGATRGIGSQILDQALAQQHQLTALIRNPETLRHTDKHLQIIKGDILDPDTVIQAIQGQEAVCISIGMLPTVKATTLFSEGTKNVIMAMQQSSVKKLICVTGIGAGDSKNHGGFFYDKLIHPFFLKTIYQDKNTQELIIQKSKLDWVIVRPGFLTNGKKTGNYQIFTNLQGVTAGKISRADVADFILKELVSMKHLRQTPLLTY